MQVGCLTSLTRATSTNSSPLLVPSPIRHTTASLVRSSATATNCPLGSSEKWRGPRPPRLTYCTGGTTSAPEAASEKTVSVSYAAGLSTGLRFDAYRKWPQGEKASSAAVQSPGLRVVSRQFGREHNDVERQAAYVSFASGGRIDTSR